MNEKHFETLDPENWQEMRDLAHQMVEDALDYVENIRDQPVWRPVPAEIAEKLKISLRSVERKLKLIRDEWSQEINA